jgi:hypothetical protein
MRLTIEIVAAALLVCCSFSVPANASPAARCAAIRRQCGGKFYANYCGDKLLSAM